MVMRTDEPNQKFLTQVREVTKDLEGFSDEDMSSLFAYNVHRYNQPIAKELLEAETPEFSGDDTKMMVKWAEDMTKYLNDEYADDDDDEDDDEDDDDKKSKNQEDKVPKFSETVLSALGLKEGASEAEVINSIAELKASTFSEDQKTDLMNMQTAFRTNQLMETTMNFSDIPGTPLEKAKKLVEIEGKYGISAAQERVEEWKVLQEAAEEAGITTRTLVTSNFNDSADGQGVIGKEIASYAETNKVTFQEAMAILAVKDAKRYYTEYSAEIETN